MLAMFINFTIVRTLSMSAAAEIESLMSDCCTLEEKRNRQRFEYYYRHLRRDPV